MATFRIKRQAPSPTASRRHDRGLPHSAAPRSLPDFLRTIPADIATSAPSRLFPSSPDAPPAPPPPLPLGPLLAPANCRSRFLCAMLPLLTWLGRTEQSVGRRAIAGGVAFATIILASTSSRT